MARVASPWFWEERNGWYVNKDGQRHFLGSNPEDAPPPVKRKGKWNVPRAIAQAFHSLMSEPAVEQVGPCPQNVPTAEGLSIAEVFDKFLDWCQKHRSGRTYEWYHDHLQSFLTHLGEQATLPVASLKPFHVVEWTDAHPDWSNAYKRGAMVAVQRPFNWADELGYIPATPIKKIKKPQPQRRDNPMSPQDFQRILGKVKESDPFRDLILFAWHTGCRPQEARHIEPRHVHLESQCVVIPKDEAKGKKRARVILLEGTALEIINRLMGEHKEGKLFRNIQGRPWKKFAVCNRFDRLMLAFGMEKLKEEGIKLDPLPRFNRRDYADKAQLAAARKNHQRKLRDRRKQLLKLARQHGRSFAAYDMRHGFTQRMLENGAHHLVVAELLGHANGRMVAETYSHMNKATGHLRETLRKAEDAGA